MAGKISAERDGGYIRVAVPDIYRGMTASEALRLMGLDIDLPCGGNGRCGKCSGYIETVTDGVKKVMPVKLCRSAVPNEGAVTVGFPETLLLGGTNVDVSGENCDACGESESSDGFLAVDIGTTTVEAVLKCCGRTLGHFAGLNPQKKYGADVISRIAFSKTPGGLERMTGDIRLCINNMLEAGRKKHPGLKIGNVYIAGNTTMQHLFMGVSPESMGHYPFTPAFTEARQLKGAEIGVNAENVTVLPSADAFIGADVVAGAELYLEDPDLPPTLFIDLGTNGEMVLKSGGRYYATSSAAGPCFEGANISCGTGGIEGAISDVKDSERGLVIGTIGDKAPVGICGSGLLSLVAVLLERGVIDETGLMEEDFEICGFLKTPGGEKPVQTGISLTRKDVREFQLAKAAIRTGVEILLEKAGLEAKDIETVYTAGGLGTHIDPSAAIRTGLLPPEFKGKCKAPGNTSLYGATAAGDDPTFLEKASALALKFETFSLNDAKDFNEKFIDNMYFD